MVKSWAPTLLGLALVLLVTEPALGSTGQVAVRTFGMQVESARQLVAACGGDAKACQSAGLPGEEQVKSEGASPAFDMSWDWLRKAVDRARESPAAQRTRTMREAGAHLVELSREIGQAAGGRSAQAAFPAVHAAAARVLARDEFRTDAGPTWFDSQVARFQDWILRLLLGADQMGARNPWIAPLLEWLCFGLALAGLLFFIRRSLGRQSLRIALEAGAALPASSGPRSTDWIRKAAQAEADGHWREAVHCVYWAAIAALETRRAWRPNPTRTPREYVRLLRGESEAQRALGALTRRFERTWYGSGSSDRDSLQAARQEFAGLAAADLKHDRAASGADTIPTAEGTAA